MDEELDILSIGNKEPATEKIMILINRFNHDFVVDVQGIGVEEACGDFGYDFSEWYVDDFPDIKEPGLYSIIIRWRLHRDYETGMIDDADMVYVSHEKLMDCFEFLKEINE